MKKCFSALLLGVILSFAMSGTALAANDSAVSGTAGNSTIEVSVDGVTPGYYLCAVWRNDEKLLVLFEATVGDDGLLRETVDVGCALEAGDEVTVGISGKNTNTEPVSYEVKIPAKETPPSPPNGNSSNSGSSGGGSSGGSSSKKPVTENPTPQPPEVNPFQDIPENHWARTEIIWAYENGIMNGTAAGTFSPNNTVTRQQLWMVLARMSGTQPANMAEARTWAVNSGITDGSNPAQTMPRQQLVTMLYRYAQKMEYDISGKKDLSIYPDVGALASYAQEAMPWAVGHGIITGTAQGTLNPGGSTSRAQFAVMLYRFYQNVVGRTSVQ